MREVLRYLIEDLIKSNSGSATGAPHIPPSFPIQTSQCMESLGHNEQRRNTM